MREPIVFLGVIALLTITPGADMAMVSRRGSRVRRELDALTGFVLVGLGIRVAAD